MMERAWLFVINHLPEIVGAFAVTTAVCTFLVGWNFLTIGLLVGTLVTGATWALLRFAK